MLEKGKSHLLPSLTIGLRVLLGGGGGDSHDSGGRDAADRQKAGEGS